MNWADLVILGIIGLSVLVSLMRGFVREALSLGIWVAAFWLAFTFADQGARLLDEWIGLPSARMTLAFALIFLLTLLLGGMLNYLAGQLISKTGLSGTDRIVGMVFGGLRGIAVITAVVMLAGLTPLPRDPWWGESLLLPHFERAAVWAADFLPEALADGIGYDRDPAASPEPAQVSLEG